MEQAGGCTVRKHRPSDDQPRGGTEGPLGIPGHTQAPAPQALLAQGRERMRGPGPTVTQGCEPSQRVSDSLLNASQLFSRKTPVVFTEKESGLGVCV